MRALRVREVLDGGDLDLDADETTDLIRYPLHRVHLALIVWCAAQTGSDELDAMERFVTDLAAANEPGLVVAAQFSSDLDNARTWVCHVLGPLATDTDGDERPRETLRGFLRNGSSFKSSVDELHLHVNSVKYRVQRVIERRGRPIDDDRIDVEVALLLCHWFGTAVLTP